MTESSDEATRDVDLAVVREVHDAWAARHDVERDPGFPGAPGGNLHFSDDDDFWQEIDRRC